MSKQSGNSTNSCIKLGTAKIDITPEISIPLAGFSSRSGSFEKVSQPLYARIFWFETNDPNPTRVLIVSADLICWGSDRMPMLKQRLKDRFGLEASSIIMHATHTHSGPQTSTLLSKLVGETSFDYLERIEEQVLIGAAQAAAGAEPVHIRRGTGSCSININRRKLVEGLVRGEPNENGPVDRDVNVFSFTREDGSLKGVFTHYACHPTISNLNEVSSEFCGAAMDRLEAELGGGAVCGYLQSCCGDVRPHLVRDGKFVYGDESDVTKLGEQLFASVISVMKAPMQLLPTSAFITRQVSVPLKLAPLPKEEHLRSWLAMSGIMGEWSSRMLQNPDRYRAPVLLDMTFIRLAEGLSLLAMNGEVVMEYGLHLKQLTHGQVLPVAYSNGMIGYVPSAIQVHEGGYEGASSYRYFGLPAPFDPSIESDILASMELLIRP
jgi:hypothetical protein